MFRTDKSKGNIFFTFGFVTLGILISCAAATRSEAGIITFTDLAGTLIPGSGVINVWDDANTSQTYTSGNLVIEGFTFDNISTLSQNVVFENKNLGTYLPGEYFSGSATTSEQPPNNWSRVTVSRDEAFNLNSLDIGLRSFDLDEPFTFHIESDTGSTSTFTQADPLLPQSPATNEWQKWNVGLTSISSFTLWIDRTPSHQGTFNIGLDNINYETASSVPEPSTIALLSIGMVGLLGGAARRKYKSKRQK